MKDFTSASHRRAIRSKVGLYYHFFPEPVAQTIDRAGCRFGPLDKLPPRCRGTCTHAGGCNFVDAARVQFPLGRSPCFPKYSPCEDNRSLRFLMSIPVEASPIHSSLSKTPPSKLGSSAGRGVVRHTDLPCGR